MQILRDFYILHLVQHVKWNIACCWLLIYISSLMSFIMNFMI